MRILLIISGALALALAAAGGVIWELGSQGKLRGHHDQVVREDSEIHLIEENTLTLRRFGISFARPNEDWEFQVGNASGTDRFGFIAVGGLVGGGVPGSTSSAIILSVFCNPHFDRPLLEAIEDRLEFRGQSLDEAQSLRHGTLDGKPCVEVIIAPKDDLNCEQRAYFAWQSDRGVCLAILHDNLKDGQFPEDVWKLFLETLKSDGGEGRLVWE
ncbi:hypothetical protein KQI84_12740 [bacterium]|nr:hypothetical protein [bacterium]